MFNGFQATVPNQKQRNINTLK